VNYSKPVASSWLCLATHLVACRVVAFMDSATLPMNAIIRQATRWDAKQGGPENPPQPP